MAVSLPGSNHPPVFADMAQPFLDTIFPCPSSSSIYLLFAHVYLASAADYHIIHVLSLFKIYYPTFCTFSHSNCLSISAYMPSFSLAILAPLMRLVTFWKAMSLA